MDELRVALSTSAPAKRRGAPDLFELRLDHLPKLEPKQVHKLRRPLIITARHPTEGGRTLAVPRRDLLLKWLPHAQFIDLELRSLRELRDVWDEAGRLHRKRICSVHHVNRTPPHRLLRKQFQRATAAGADIFKLVTRADAPRDLATLLGFLTAAKRPCCVMAIGPFGLISRLVFPECGSVLVYGAIEHALYPGQPTVAEVRRLGVLLRENEPRRAKL